jgi:hypothetical protein
MYKFSLIILKQYDHLYTIYIVLFIISNLEMI